MKKILLILLTIFTFSSCGFDVKPNVSVKNDINLTMVKLKYPKKLKKIQKIILT